MATKRFFREIAPFVVVQTFPRKLWKKLIYAKYFNEKMSSENRGSDSGEERGETDENVTGKNGPGDEGDEFDEDGNNSRSEQDTVAIGISLLFVVNRNTPSKQKDDKKDLKAKVKAPSRIEKKEPGQSEPTHKGHWTDSGTAQSKPTYTKDLGTQSESDGLGIMVSKVGFLLALAAVCVATAVYIAPPETDMKSDFDLVKVFGNGVDRLQSSFTNQTERFWKILRNRGLAHLRNKDPLQPLVFLLAAPPPAHGWVDCLATKLAEKLDPRHKRNLAIIDGKKEKTNPPDETKKTMDIFLKEKFSAGHRVALIHHLELLPPPSPLLFYSYCDDQNAPHKHVAIIFTVHMPVEPSSSLSPKEAEGSLEKYLSDEVWVKDEKDAVVALLSRIADTVVLMNGDSSGSANDLCS